MLVCCCRDVLDTRGWRDVFPLMSGEWRAEKYDDKDSGRRRKERHSMEAMLGIGGKMSSEVRGGRGGDRDETYLQMIME